MPPIGVGKADRAWRKIACGATAGKIGGFPHGRAAAGALTSALRTTRYIELL
jgi:hypothetical protein